MTESVVAFFLGKLDELLTSKLDLIRGVDIKILSLLNKLSLMRAFLKDVDARRRDNERIRVWVDQVRGVAFRAEDAIDKYIYEVQRRRHTGFVGSMKNVVSHTRRLRIRYQLGCEIEEIRQMLQEITDSISMFGIDLQKSEEESSSSYPSAPRQQNTAKRVDVEETNVIGFDPDITNLVKQVTKEGQGDVVVAIVGMGGLGKTTLARSVYNHADVNRYFDCQAWISVSQKYRQRELLISILEDLLTPKKEKSKGKKEDEKEESKLKKEDEMEKLDRETLDKMPESEMEKKIKRYLHGKKYLLVVDDIWDGGAWSYISHALPGEKNGRRIILTTRNEDVAKCVDPTASAYKIKELGEADSWKLFCSKIFKTDECIDEKLEALGREMVKKCAGLPLAITVLGGLLSRQQKSDIEWTRVSKRIMHELHEREGSRSVRRILAISYDDLPYYLRSCFLYFGLFPEDSKIDVDVLIKLWVAEGFIQSRGEQTMEEVAEDYVEELVDRCMIQVVKRNSWGRVDTCRIHDLLLDLCISQGKEDKFLGVVAAGDLPANAYFAVASRRVAIHSGSFSQFMSTNQSSPRLFRSFLCSGPEVGLSRVRLLTNNMKLLRVLDLKLEGFILRLPKQIGGLVHLRYLGLEFDDNGILPSSVGKLCNLQTLRLKGNTFSVPNTV